MPPSTLGPYRILRPLGHGGMGEVHLAERDGRRLALKLLSGPAPSPALLERFATEATVRIAHPNVVEVLDAGSIEGRAFIALELLEGETLREWFDRGPVPPEELAELGAQAARGLHAAHEAGIIHRDIKPSNLFLTHEGVLKVIDFGVALVDHAARLTNPGAVPGTMGYLSPEQAAGHEATRRSDLWSLGAVLYEGLAGRPPHLRPTPLATAIATLLEEPPALQALAPSCPASLVRVVERALARDAAERFPTAAALAEALTDHARSGAAEGRGPSPRAPSMRPGERRVVAVLLAEGVRGARAASEAIAAIEAAKGSVTPLAGGRLLGLFGADRWLGDELDRAAATALRIRPHAARLALASGWASSEQGGVGGAAIDAVERAAAEPLEGVAVDEAAARVLEDRFVLHEVAAGIHELRETRRAPTKTGADLPLVGREAEMAQLHAALRTAENDRRGVVATIVGPPGIGKSRLLEDFGRQLGLGDEGATPVLLEATGTTQGQHEEYGWLRRLAQASAPAVSERLASLEGGDLGVQRDRVHRLLFEWLDAQVAEAEAGVVLALDDAHWSDGPSLELVDELLEEVDGAFYVVAASRDDDLFEDRAPVRIVPRPLDRSAIATLVEAVTEQTPSPESLADLAQRTGGNPLFVVHCAAALEQGGSRPLTVEAAVQIRLDALPEPERQLCRVAAVFQRPFGSAELAAIEPFEPALLPALVRRSLLARRGRRREARYDFANRIIAEVAYESSTEERRRALHTRIGRMATDPAERAFHLERAGRALEAAEAYAAAAEAAVRRGDCSAALHSAERALELGIDESHHFELSMVRADALRFLGGRAEQREALDAAARAARTPGERGRVLSELAVWHWRSGDGATAQEVSAEAVAQADASDSPEAKVLAHGRRFLVCGGATAEGEAALGEAAKHADLVDASLRAMLLAWEAHHHATTGAIGEQLGAYAELVEAYDALGDLRRKAGAEVNLADTYNRLGAHAEAAEALESALEACRLVRNRTLEGYALLNLGYARLALGEREAAMEALDGAARLAETQGEARLAAWVRLYRARALPPAEARELLEALLAEPLAGMDEIRAGAAATLARAALALGDEPTAGERSAEAMAILRRLGRIQENEAAIFWSRIAVLRAGGDDDAAQALTEELEARIAARAAAIDDEVLRARFLEGQREGALGALTGDRPGT